MNENEENPFLSIFEENKCLLRNDTEKESQNEHKEKVHQEQGWYPWLVVACSFLCICVLDGVGYSFGVLFEPLLKDLSDGHGRGTLAIAGSLQVKKKYYIMHKATKKKLSTTQLYNPL